MCSIKRHIIGDKMKETNVLIKMNINKNEKKEILNIKDNINYLVVKVGLFNLFNVGYIKDLKLLDKKNNIECIIDDKFVSILKDKIDYINFKKEYQKQQGKVVFEIKLKKMLDKNEEKEFKSHFE